MRPWFPVKTAKSFQPVHGISQNSKPALCLRWTARSVCFGCQIRIRNGRGSLATAWNYSDEFHCVRLSCEWHDQQQGKQWCSLHASSCLQSFLRWKPAPNFSLPHGGRQPWPMGDVFQDHSRHGVPTWFEYPNRWPKRDSEERQVHFLENQGNYRKNYLQDIRQVWKPISCRGQSAY